MFVLTTVSYKMDSVYFSPTERPLDVNSIFDSIVESSVSDCSQNYTVGK